jgi:NADH-quinone oxidoreductase subunit E
MDIASILKKYPKRREFVLEILHDLQNQDQSHHLTDSALVKVAHHVNLPVAHLYGVVGYYSMLSTKPRGKYIIQVCISPVCNMLGSESILATLRKTLRGDSLKQFEHLFTIEESECLGLCAKSPCMMINGKIYSDLTPEKIEAIILDLGSAI